jgi:ribosomal protein S18 acetylase RimI-like enzyme
MTAASIKPVVVLQTAFLEGSIVTQLGPGFLARFHTVALTHDSSRAFVAVDDDNEVVGFALGTVDVRRFNAYIKPRVLPAMIGALLSPLRIGLLGSLGRMVLEGEPQPPMPAELLLLVVHPKSRRCGVGRSLLRAMESAFLQEEIRRYRVAARSHLTVARAFYEALDFEHEQDRTVLGQPMVYLTKKVEVNTTHTGNPSSRRVAEEQR